MNKKLLILISFFGYLLGGIIVFLIGIGGAIIFLIPLIVGAMFGHWINGKYEKNKWINFIAWSNTVSWIIPFIGLFTGITTFFIAEKDKNYIYLGSFGLFFTLIIIIISIIIELQKNGISIYDIEGNYTYLIAIIVMGIINTYQSYKKTIKEKQPSL